MIEDVIEFRQLDERITVDRWRQAELAFHATLGPEALSQAAFAREVKRDPTHIGVLVRVWALYGKRSPGQRPDFSAAYDEAKNRSDRRTEDLSSYQQDGKRAVLTLPASEKVQLIEELERDAEVQARQAEHRRQSLDWPPPRDRETEPKPSDLLAAVTRARQAMREAAQSAGVQEIPEHLREQIVTKLNEIKDTADQINDLLYVKWEL